MKKENSKSNKNKRRYSELQTDMLLYNIFGYKEDLHLILLKTLKGEYNNED